MIKYKLTDQNLRTYGGYQWTVDVEKTIDNPGNRLCSDQVFHFYDSPEEAVFLNPIFGDIPDPLCWEVECDQVVHDGLKGGAKKMKLIRQVALLTITTETMIRIAIRCSMLVYKEEKWNIWAKKWLTGEDRSGEAAARAAWAARAESVDTQILSIVMQIKSIIKEEVNKCLRNQI